MFLEMFGLYLNGLLLSILLVLVSGGGWLVWRALRKLDKTAKERRAFLYDILVMAIITTPVLAFAFMVILLVFKA